MYFKGAGDLLKLIILLATYKNIKTVQIIELTTFIEIDFFFHLYFTALSQPY